MLTLADVQADWTGIHRIVMQRDFTPSVLELESEAKGYSHSCIPKHAFKGAIAKYLMVANRDPVLPTVYSGCLKVCGIRQLVREHGVSIAEYCRNFVSFVGNTGYCDALLARYRIMNEKAFSDFAYDCLFEWSKTSEYRYEQEYLPGILKRSGRISDGYAERIDSLESAIIEKTKSLLEEKACGNRQLRAYKAAPDV